MAFQIRQVYEPGQSLYAYIRKVVNNIQTDIWDDDDEVWDTGGTLPLTGNDERITLTAGTGVQTALYSGATSSDLAGHTGRVSVSVVDISLGYVVVEYDVEVVNGIEVSPTTVYTPAVLIEGLEENKQQVVGIPVGNPHTAGPATGSVLQTQIADVSSTPSFVNCTNAAVFSGSPGNYQVTLTSAEVNTGNSRLVRITTSDGVGEALLTFGLRAIEEDWQDAGRLDLILDATASDAADAKAASEANSVAIFNLPGATDMADAVWQEILAPHIGAGSAAEFVDRLSLIASGGAGELTAARADNLDNLDAAVSSLPNAAAVNAQVQAVIEANHLDHLLAAAYNPGAKPGAGTALLNILVESDGGVPRFTSNALETAPAAAGGISAASIADAVWDENRTGHSIAGTFGQIWDQLVDILADTAELQGDWENGGRLDLIVDAINTLVGTINTTVGTINTNVGNLPSAAAIADAVHDEPAAGHTTASTMGELFNRLAIFATGGAAELTPALANNLANLDAAISSRPTAVQVRQELDTASTKLINIDSLITNLEAWWDTGGSLYTTLNAIPTDDAAAIRAEIDANSTQLALAAAGAVSAADSLADGGFTDLLIDTIIANQRPAKIDAIDTTLKAGGTIHTLITNITPNPNTLSAEFVAAVRTWMAPKERDTAANIITLSETDEAFLAMDFSKRLNPDTGIGLAGGWTVVEGDAGDLTIDTPVVSQHGYQVHAKVSGQLSGKRYKIWVQITTTDNEVISAYGYLQTSTHP